MIDQTFANTGIKMGPVSMDQLGGLAQGSGISPEVFCSHIATLLDSVMGSQEVKNLTSKA